MPSTVLTMVEPSGRTRHFEMEKLYTFRMRGIRVFASAVVARELRTVNSGVDESIPLDEFDPLDPTCLHLQNVCRVRLDGQPGVGVLEQIALGPHVPTGLTGVRDGYRPRG